MEWIDDLIDNIDALLQNDKSVKFNTHKNRKRIVGTIGGMIKTAVAENAITINKPDEPKRKELPPKLQDVVTRINPDKKSTGFAVATESTSSQVDDAHGNVKRPSSGYDRSQVNRNNAINERRDQQYRSGQNVG